MVQSRELVTKHILCQRPYIYKRKMMKIDLTNGGPLGAKAGCPVRGLLLGCDIS